MISFLINIDMSLNRQLKEEERKSGDRFRVNMQSKQIFSKLGQGLGLDQLSEYQIEKLIQTVDDLF
ncbi:MAG: hypothetical protein ACW981_07890 [Candidatus Hodarchaeales archaeon]|jgi:hypothetical protein